MNMRKNASNNSNWILCRSKNNCPGKLYYFNVLTGEAVWKINEEEKSKENHLNPEKFNISFNEYPEPSSPDHQEPNITPANNWPNTSTSNNWPNTSTSSNCPNTPPSNNWPTQTFPNRNFVQTYPPMFGQPTTFPKNPEQFIPMTNVMWMPIPVPAPTWPYFARRPTSDKITQTQKDKPILVEATKKPLYQRFVNYATLNNGNTNRPTFFSSTPIKILKTTSRNCMDAILEQNNSETEITQSKLSRLDSSDLRYLLVAKRRKLQEELQDSVEKKKIKTQEPLPTPKKKVTFNLDNLNVDLESESDESGTVILTDPRVMRSSKPYTPLSPPGITSNYSISIVNKQVYSDTRDNNIPIYYNMPILSEDNIENIGISPKITNEKILDNQADLPIDKYKNQYDVANNNLLNKNDMANDNNMANCNNMTNDNVESNNDKLKNKNVTYLVVDMDILLDDFMFIDKLLQSDEKYKLLIPHSLRSEVEAICIGDCRGQQRVLIARQLSRKMLTSHKQYEVEPPSAENTADNTTDSILNCCQRAVKNNYNVILITYDPYLITKAKALNINCYKPQEIKNGALKNADLFTELKKIKITVDNFDDQINNNSNQKINKENFWPVNSFKKQLFVNEEKTNKNCDILINITKPNSIINKNIDQIEIKNGGQKNNFELSENVEITENFQNIKLSNPHSQKCSNFQPTQVIKKVFDSIPGPNNESSAHNLNVTNDKITNDRNITTSETKYRIEKNMNSITPKIPNSNENCNIAATINKTRLSINKTSSPFESWSATDNVRSNFKNTTLPLEERLNNFCVRSKAMHDKVKIRMDEWTCTYTQIMEELLNSILQNNSEYMNKICVGYRNLQESLTCVKMMYDNTELTDVVKVLIGMLAKCTCNKGKLKLDTTPNDFMKIFGCGILLVHILKKILPTKEELNEYDSALEALLRNIECENTDIDPELLKPMTVCRSEVNQDNNTRINFIKPPSDIIKYLKKHFKEWSTYDEQIHAEKTSPNVNQYKVVRVFGQNTNMLRIDSNKNLLYATNVSGQENDGLPSEDKIKKLNPQNKETNDEKNVITTKEAYKNSENAEQKMIENKQQIENEVKNKEPLDLDALNYSEINADTDDITIEIRSNNFNNNDQFSYQNGASRKNDQNVNNNLMLEDINSESNYADSVNKTVVGHNSRNNSMTINNDIDENYATDEWNSNDNYAKNNGNYAPNNENYTPDGESYAPDGESYAPNNESYAPNNENCADNNNQRDDSNDSGFENDSTQAYTVIKIFLNELSATYKIVYEFVVSFVEELRGKDMSQERKNILHIKSSRCLQNLIAIIRQLRTIIKRESHEDTVLKSLLLTAGVEATSDKRITRYRQIVLKCLEQAQILENALKAIACITIEDLDAISNNADSISSSIRYLNVFE